MEPAQPQLQSGKVRRLRLDWQLRPLASQQPKERLRLYFANVSSWSLKAQEYYRHAVQADVLMAVETHLSPARHRTSLRQLDRDGFRVSGRAAIPTGKSVAGTTGGVFTAINKSARVVLLGAG